MTGDPRSIVTPDAFSVTPGLLGTPLAEPWRRFVALMVDLVLIGFLQLLGWRVLGGVAALMLFRMATRRPDGTVGGPARKIALGCAGALVLVVAVGVTSAIPSVIRMMVRPDRGEVPAVVNEAEGAEGGQDAPDDERDQGGLILNLPDRDSTSEAAPSLAPQIRDSVALDTIAALHARLAGVQSDLQDSREDLGETQEALADAESRSTLFTWIRDAADEAGLIFGWGTVYLTLFLAMWEGRTPGKKVMGLRVVRLNGQPLGLYMSLERAGGYAAGVATGLLGFAQLWWDPNRQAIHDKIAETVVIREGVPNRLRAERLSREGVAEPAAEHQD